LFVTNNNKEGLSNDNIKSFSEDILCMIQYKKAEDIQLDTFLKPDKLSAFYKEIAGSKSSVHVNQNYLLLL
jgi:hypothetical protein